MRLDMTKDSPGKSLFYFAVPMVLGNMFQQLYNIIDSMIVGNFVGADALAAVGASTTITTLFVAFATGMSIGSSVVISQYFGAGKMGEMRTSISTTVLTSLGLSLFLSLVGMLTSGAILGFLNTPQNIFENATGYLRIYFGGLVFLFLYNTLTAVFNAIGDSRSPLVFLLFSSVVNIVLDLWFVAGLHWGVAGAAVATVIAQGVSCILSLFWLVHKLRKWMGKEPYRRYDVGMLKTISRIAVPSVLQQSIVSLGFLAVQALVNSFGSTVIAGYTAASKIDSVAILPMVNVGNAVSTYTAQNLGAKKPERIGQGLRAGIFLSVGVALVISTSLFLWGDVFVSAFVDSASNPGVILVGEEYLRVVGVCYLLMGIMNNFNGVLRGAGDVKVFMTVTLCNFGARVILAYGLAAFLGQKAIWYSIPIGWLAGGVLAGGRYFSGKWKNKKVI